MLEDEDALDAYSLGPFAKHGRVPTTVAQGPSAASGSSAFSRAEKRPLLPPHSQPHLAGQWSVGQLWKDAHVDQGGAPSGKIVQCRLCKNLTCFFSDVSIQAQVYENWIQYEKKMTKDFDSNLKFAKTSILAHMNSLEGARTFSSSAMATLRRPSTANRIYLTRKKTFDQVYHFFSRLF